MRFHAACFIVVISILAKRADCSSSAKDMLDEDAEDAEAYARYMAATEASAPLMRARTWQTSTGVGSHGGGVSSSSSSSAPGAKINYRPQSNHFGAPKQAKEAVDWQHYPFVNQLTHVWSAWSTWSKCSRSCGTGITARHRTCRAEYIRVSAGSGIRSSSQRCIGLSTEYSLCNQQNCPPSTEDFRSFQCSQYKNRTVRGNFVSAWTPYNIGSNECELTCKAVGKGFVYTFGKVLDGTRCNIKNENDDSDFCVNGRCLAVGCDGRIGSPARRDMCHVCAGNNDTCSKIAAVSLPSHSLLRSRSSSQQVTYGYSPVVRIPRGATHIRVTDNSSNYLALMDDRHHYFLNGNWIIDWPGSYQGSGAAFIYNRSKDEAETISSKGPLVHDVILMVLIRDRTPGIYYEYWLPRATLLSVDPDDDIYTSDTEDILSARPLPFHQQTSPPTAKPITTTSAPVVTIAEEEMYEPQPTAASLVRHQPRMAHIFTMPSPTTTTPPPPQITTRTPTTTKTPTTTWALTTTRAPATTAVAVLKTSRKKQRSQRKNETHIDKKVRHKGRRNGRAKADANGAEDGAGSGANRRAKIQHVRQHLGTYHKHSKGLKSSPKQHPTAVAKVCPNSDTTCWKTVNGKKHFCVSEFVMRCKVLNYETINGETRYEVQIIQSYKNTLPILNREFIWAEPVNCPCPYLRQGVEYIIMGKTDKSFRRNEVRLLLDRDSYVRIYNSGNAERVMRIRREEFKYCHKYRTKFNLTV